MRLTLCVLLLQVASPGSFLVVNNETSLQTSSPLVTREMAILPSLTDIQVDMYILEMKTSENTTKVFRFNDKVKQVSQLASQLDKEKEVIFMTHGWLGSLSASKFWWQPLIEITEAADKQVIFVDWSGAASSSYYLPSVSNLRPVAAIWASVIQNLVDHEDFDPLKMRLIGFSLGAHLVGFTGKLLTGKYKLARITGLEPANAAFEMASTEGLLFKTDAHFVDVIHTASGSVFQGFSRADPLGCIDFYPNGGKFQPGCDKDLPFGAVGGFFSNHRPCVHDRAPIIFTKDWSHSSEECQPVAYLCNSYEEFLAGKCASCQSGSCALMGLYWDLKYPLQKLQSCKYLQSFYIQDAGDGSCVYHYQIKVTIKDTSSGQMMLKVPGPTKKPFTLLLHKDADDGVIFTGLLTTRELIPKDYPLMLEWTAGTFFDSIWPGEFAVDLAKVQLNYLSHSNETVRANNSYFYCGGKIRSGSRLNLKLCSK